MASCSLSRCFNLKSRVAPDWNLVKLVVALWLTLPVFVAAVVIVIVVLLNIM